MGVCPECGFRGTATVFVNDVDARKAIEKVANLSSDPLPGLALHYITLFQDPKSERSASWTKGSRLLNELEALIKAGHVQYKGQPARSTTPKIWADAISEMLDRREKKTFELPAKNHNYLLSIVYDLADKSDKKAEVVRNKSENAGRYHRTETIPVPEGVDLNFMKQVRADKFPKRARREEPEKDMSHNYDPPETPKKESVDDRVSKMVEMFSDRDDPIGYVRELIMKIKNPEYKEAFERLYDGR